MAGTKYFDLLIVDAGLRKVVVYTPRFEHIQKGETVNFFFDGNAASGTVIDVYGYQEYKDNLWNALSLATGHEPVKCLSRTYTESIEWTDEDEIETEEKEENENDTV